MSKPDPTWEAFESDVAELFGLRRTITSGNKFFDPGDAVSPPDDPFPLYVDAKYTERLSYSLKLKDLQNYRDQAAHLGKHLVLPLRFWPRGQHGPQDFAVVDLYDLHDLVTQARQRANGI